MTRTDLRWVQPQAEPGYHELIDGSGATIATLRFAPAPAFAWSASNPKRARLDAGAAHWDFSLERPGLGGLLGTRANVLIAGSLSGTLTAGPFFIRGRLELGNAMRFRWNGGAFRRGPSAFQDDEGRPSVTFEEGSIFDRVNTHIVVPDETLTKEHLLLIGLGLYLRLAMTKTFRR